VLEHADKIPAGAPVEVVLDSSGGQLPALEIGRIIHKRKFQTIARGYCASLCASIWLAGIPRFGFYPVGRRR
jgi:hypothetical protein